MTVTQPSLTLQCPRMGGHGFIHSRFESSLFPSDLLVVFDGLDPADRLVANAMGNTFRDEIKRLPGVVEKQHELFPAQLDPKQSWRLGPGSQRLYVRISLASKRLAAPAVSPWPPNYAEDAWRAQIGSPDWHVFPCLPLPTDTWKEAKQGMPVEWHTINAGFWESDPRTLLPSVMTRIGLAPEENRIFLSYLRRESNDVAEQLFEALSRRGFEVFLDRYSLRAGASCQESIMQDIDDKAVVVLLSTVGVVNAVSSWVEEEVSRVKLYRLGLMVVQFPGATPRNDLAPDGTATLSGTDFLPPAGAGASFGPLTDPALEALVDQIRRVHATAVHRRRFQLHDSFSGMLRAAGKHVTDLPGGGFVCRARTGETVVVAMSPRPPGLFEFFGLHDRGGIGTAASATEGLIFSPAPFVVARRRSGVEWLGGVCRIRHVDEAQMQDIVDQLQ